MSPALSRSPERSEGTVEGMVEWRSILWVILAYALITVVVTYPMAFRLRSALAGALDQDALQHLWISWWTEKALLDLGISPAQASYLYYPDGTYHPMLWVTPYPQVAALELSVRPPSGGCQAGTSPFAASAGDAYSTAHTGRPARARHAFCRRHTSDGRRTRRHRRCSNPSGCPAGVDRQSKSSDQCGR